MRRGALALLAGAALAIGCWAVPATSGAYSAQIDAPSAALRSNRTFTCADSAAGKPALFAYPLTDAAGSTTAVDTSGNGATGAFDAAITTAPAAACPRDGGTAWAPDGVQSRLTSPMVGLPSSFSFELWFRTSRANEVLTTIFIPDFGGTYGLALDGAGAVVLGGQGAELIASTRDGYADGGWHQLDLVSRGGTIELLLDGAPTGSPVAAQLPNGIRTQWSLAWGDLSQATARISSAQHFLGVMRYAELSSAAFTSDEIADRYRAGAP